MSLIVCFTWLLLICHEAEPAVTAFGSLKPSNPSFVREGDNITLKWNYTIDGSIGVAQFFNVTDDASIAAKFGDGDMNVAAEYQERFKADVSNTLAQLTIITVQRSDSGPYKFTLTSTKIVAISDEVELKVQFEASFTSSPSGDQTVNEGSDLTLFCNATGKPHPNVTWTRVLKNGTDGDVVFFRNPWIIVNISRTATGTYRCTAYNGIGNPVSHSLYVNVTYQPDMVTLMTNTTENKDCSDLWVNFTCISSEANPPVYNYLLSDDEDGFSLSESGTWVKKISKGGKSIYNCLAFQLVENITSARNITLTVNVPASVEQLEDKNIIEGDNLQEYCKTAGNPDPTVMWTYVKTGELIKENPLNITNINRTQAGEYKCTANNTCGEASTMMNINVQYVPENVILTTNTTSKVCTGVVINFTCTAEASPPVHTYLLYGNDTRIKNMGIPTTFIKTMENAGHFVFRCEANNSIQGIGKSGNTTITVDVPASVEQVKKIKNVTEGDTVEVYCNVTAGIPDPTVMWTKVKTGEQSKENPLNITNINRTQAGEYKCTANNTCGEASTVMKINVQYGPKNVILTTNTTSKVCKGAVINFTCTAETNPPVHTYLLYANDTMIKNMGIPGTWIKTMENAGQFVFRCEANNSIQGIGTSDNTTLTVDVPASVEQAENRVVKEGDNVELYCNVTAGIPPPTVLWTNITTGEHVEVNPLNITNIHRAQAGKYKCTANNTCGVDSTLVDIHVQYPPTDMRKGDIRVSEGQPASISCPVDGNPQPNITWFKGSDMLSGTLINTNRTLKFAETVLDNSGWYTCFAENYLGNVTVTVQLHVEKASTPITSSEPVTEEPGIVASEVNGTMKVTNVPYTKELANMASKDSQNLTTRCKNVFREVYQSTDTFNGVYNDTEVNKFENGSVVVFFTIIFNDVVRIDDAILVLRSASENGTLGDLKVEPGSIKALRPVPTTLATSSPTAATRAASDDDNNKDLWIIIGASVGGTIVLAIVVAVVTWCVHHKRKCRRKGSKVCCSESEAFTPEKDNDHGHPNNGYADSGPRPAEMKDMSQHQGASAVPTYAVVDKSKKKESKKGKKVEEEKPQAAPPQYAAGDKSKKGKKKEEAEATYAQVFKSKTSMKKPNPGDVLYADLGDFHQMKELPAVSTSPQALPPIKKPTPYTETQYADITQFLKGNVTLPESNNSQGPAAGTQAAPASENSNSQKPGASTKETSQASNTGGDGGPGHETNF